VVAANAEHYYRTMVRGDRQSWNIRDHHMADTIDRIAHHHGPGSKGLVWAHNTHVGDARATDTARAGMVNIGQLLRQRHPEEVLTGFTSYSGSVTAAQAWGEPEETMTVPAAGTGSHEDLLKQVLPEPALLMFDRDPSGTSLNTPRGHRAIGVVYDPRHESGNYVPTQMGRLATHFDAGMPVPADRRPFTRSWPPRSMAGPQARHWAQVAAT
jgi:erythromycin esterase-like protein